MMDNGSDFDIGLTSGSRPSESSSRPSASGKGRPEGGVPPGAPHGIPPRNPWDLGGSQTVVDRATPIGMAAGGVLLLLAILLGGSPLAFLNIPSVLIVFGGVAAVTVSSFSWSDIKGSWPAIRCAVTYRRRDPHEAAMHVLEIADYARHYGLLRLQGTVHHSANGEPLLFNGLQHVIDAMPVQEVEQVLRTHSAARAYRHGRATSMLRRAADVAPAMGLIGTLVGLVQMLGALDDPTSIGPGMAVALLTTLYGACLAHLVLSPLAAKLERNSAEESLLDEVYILGVTSVGRKDNPRRLEMQLNSILPPTQRVHFYD
ncbi:motility protein A [Insolitispirillum peregrinum]|uniref:motility protein A n=1 Tax=Insolitispirillum peregrinum TaxID=80876 RepID=UPI0036D4355B